MTTKSPTLDVAVVEAFEQDVPLPALHLLTQSSLLAVRHQMIGEADLIASGLGIFTPYYTAVAMAQAVVAAANNRQAEALEVLERLVAEDPDAHSAACACAMLRKELGLPGWRELALRVIERGASDPQSLGRAQELLELAGPPSRGAALHGASAVQVGLRFA
jgi:hypothetical protein